tara:strand:+ start:2962 stop:4248 length:1287 start_codon:yes stop_codon:yes gene_type:complete
MRHPSSASSSSEVSQGNIQSASARRRRKLTALSHEIDESTKAERRKCVRALLFQPIVVSQSGSNEIFSMIRRHSEWLKHWFSHYTGWSLFINSELARLNKTAADPTDASRPCRDRKNGAAFSKRRYVLLCLALSSLERSQRQTTLGHLSQDVVALIKGNEAFAEHGLHFTLEAIDERRDFVQVLRKLIELCVLERIQGSEEKFIHNQASDALYSVNHGILGRLMAARQSPSLLSQTKPQGRLHALAFEPVAESDEARNRAIRIKLYRHLLDDPVLFYKDLSESELLYWEKQRPSILREIRNQTDLIPELRREGVAMVDLGGDLTDYGLPEEGTDGHLTLLLAEYLGDRLRKNAETRIPKEDLYRKTEQLIQVHRKHWRKNVADPGMHKTLTNQVLTQLEGLRLIELAEDHITPQPTIARYGLKGYEES